ncbi:hypothetical protein [Roseobacter sp. HKCCA0434]|uniref:hypothetical protein n=1 Tax=Roseobacter sp. HKCCA0434 TaxID=3079297 RepID=UPI00290590DA|nr:hypothetical protein [Roseobacter sp. HKCCA0434]
MSDEESAMEAIKMAGLPILVIGANAALLALNSIAEQTSNYIVAKLSALIAVLLFILAFRVRSGHAAWVPFALILFVGFLVTNISATYMNAMTYGAFSSFNGYILLGWIVPLICLLLAFSGLKGWLWMRANGMKISF